MSVLQNLKKQHAEVQASPFDALLQQSTLPVVHNPQQAYAAHSDGPKLLADDTPSADTMGAPDVAGCDKRPPVFAAPVRCRTPLRVHAHAGRQRIVWPLRMLCCAAPSVADDSRGSLGNRPAQFSLSPASSGLGPEELNALMSSPTAGGPGLRRVRSSDPVMMSAGEDGCCRVIVGENGSAPLAWGPKSPSAADAGSDLVPPLLAGTIAPRLSLCERRSMAGSDWFDAASAFDPADCTDLDGLESLHADGSETVPRPVPQSGPHVPSPPLLVADKDYEFVPVPDDLSAFHGYWLMDPDRPLPVPHPIDVMLGNSRFALRAHEAIPGVLLHNTAGRVTLTCKPQNIRLGSLSRYVETFAKDGSKTYWNVRRDVRIGRSCGEMYFTACGTLILRVWGIGLFTTDADIVCEDYVRVITTENGGRALINRQCGVHLASGRTAVQHMVGNYMGPEALPGHA